MSLLLSPANVAKLELNNRVVMSPMCMYQVDKKDGIANDFHFAHYGARALSKVGMIIIEATAVTPDGRITDQDLGLWNDEQAAQLTKLVKMLHSFGTKVGIQLNHAGRKAENADRVLAPSAVRYNEKYDNPSAMTLAEIKATQISFIEAAKRAINAGVDMIELHGAHGYLMDQFLSPATNQRTDQYGGTLENRYRFVNEIIQSMREFYSDSLWIRLSMTDYLENDQQNSIEDWQKVGKWLETDGIDCIDVSTGGLVDQKPNIPVYEGYQAPYTVEMKKAVSIPVTALGLLDNPGLCEYLLQTNQADLVLEGRAMIRNVNWLANAATTLHDHEFTAYNGSYERGRKK
jgi:NADPH2 dehydrogenase